MSQREGLAAASLAGAPSPARGTLALIGGRLLDGHGGVARQHATVLVRDGRIDRVADANERIRSDRCIDVGGRTIMPGLVDAHVHLSSLQLPDSAAGEDPASVDVRPYAQARAAEDILAAGITTARDVGSYGRELFALREAAGLALCVAPRLLLCGQIISVSSPGGRRFSDMYREADGADELRKATREQLRQGADFIKLMSGGALTVPNEPLGPSQMTSEEMDAVVSEAHRLGVRVASHAEGLGGIRLSIEAGVDTIEHGEQLFRAPELLEMMTTRGIILVPTLSVFHFVSDDACCHFPWHLVEQAKRLREDAYETVEAARAAGVSIAMGFDAHPHGANALELIRLVDAGMSAAEAIAAATTVAAQACGLTDVGQIAKGALADLLVLDGDPLKDVRTFADSESIWLVLQAGHVVAGTHVSTTQSESGESCKQLVGTSRVGEKTEAIPEEDVRIQTRRKGKRAPQSERSGSAIDESRGHRGNTRA